VSQGPIHRNTFGCKRSPSMNCLALLPETSPLRYHCLLEKTHCEPRRGSAVKRKTHGDEANGKSEMQRTERMPLPIVEARESAIRARKRKKICLLTWRSTAVRLTGAALDVSDEDGRMRKPKSALNDLIHLSLTHDITYVAFLINLVSFPPTTTIP
jgi:hypothetical protein